jgi:hypothetical protein
MITSAQRAALNQLDDAGHPGPHSSPYKWITALRTPARRSPTPRPSLNPARPRFSLRTLGLELRLMPAGLVAQSTSLLRRLRPKRTS